MRTGGSYKTDANGKTTQVQKPTRDHPMGNKARAADGKDEPTRVIEEGEQKPVKRQNRRRSNTDK